MRLAIELASPLHMPLWSKTVV